VLPDTGKKPATASATTPPTTTGQKSGIIGNFVNVMSLRSQHEVINVVNQVTRKDMLTSEVRSFKN